MSKPKSPFYSYNRGRKPVIYYQHFSNSCHIFYFGNRTRYGDLEWILGSHISRRSNFFNNLCQSLENSIFCNKIFLIFQSLQNYNVIVNSKLNIPMIPNPNTNKKIYLSNLEYILLNKHVEYFDQHVGTKQSILSDKDFKFFKYAQSYL